MAKPVGRNYKRGSLLAHSPPANCGNWQPQVVRGFSRCKSADIARVAQIAYRPIFNGF